MVDINDALDNNRGGFDIDGLNIDNTGGALVAADTIDLNATNNTTVAASITTSSGDVNLTATETLDITADVTSGNDISLTGTL